MKPARLYTIENEEHELLHLDKWKSQGSVIAQVKQLHLMPLTVHPGQWGLYSWV